MLPGVVQGSASPTWGIAPKSPPGCSRTQGVGMGQQNAGRGLAPLQENLNLRMKKNQQKNNPKNSSLSMCTACSGLLQPDVAAGFNLFAEPEGSCAGAFWQLLPRLYVLRVSGLCSPCLPPFTLFEMNLG